MQVSLSVVQLLIGQGWIYIWNMYTYMYTLAVTCLELFINQWLQGNYHIFTISKQKYNSLSYLITEVGNTFHSFQIHCRELGIRKT